MIPATYPSVLDSSNRTKMLVYQVPSITGLTRWVDYIPVKSPVSEADLTLANTYANEGFILTTKVNDITGLVPFKDYVPIYIDSTATKAWSADNDGYIPMSELAGLLLDFTTGSLDSRINFSRTSNATVTNSAGVITYAPHNLLTYSEQFDNAAWTKTGSTITANNIVAPNETTTADKLVETAVTSGHNVQVATTLAATTYTVSVYAKKAENNYLWIRVDALTFNKWVYFNLDLGTTYTTDTGITYSISPSSNGFYRCSVTWAVTTAGTGTVYYGTTDTEGVVSYLGDGTSGIYIWGAQLEIGSTATTYNSTTVKNLLGFSELFDNAAWTKSNSFVQTNLLTYSEAFDNAAWTKINTTIASNLINSPNGYQTADSITRTATSSSSQARFISAQSNSTTYTLSVYAKAGTTNNSLVLRNLAVDNGFTNGVVKFNLNNGTIDLTYGSTYTGKATITSVGDGWYRCSITGTTIASVVNNLVDIGLASSLSSDGSIGDFLYIWGAQLVQGATAGDYRRTDAAALPIYYANHNGVVCAEKLVENTATSEHRIQVTPTLGTAPITASIYFKASERSWAFIRLDDSISVKYAYFNLSTGIVGTVTTGLTASIVNAGNGWYRCSATFNAPSAGSGGILFAPTTGNGTSSYTGNGTSGIYIFGAQVSDSASLDPYVLNVATAPSAAAYYGARFYYDPVTLAPKGLLIEEQRSNLSLYSDDFSNAYWVKSGVTLTANSVVSPDGATNADRLEEDATNAQHYTGRTSAITVGSASVNTLSIYAKAGERNWLWIYVGGFGNGSNCTAYFNLTTGVVGTVGAGATTTSITPVGNGWYRCTITGTSVATSCSPEFHTVLSNGGSISYQGVVNNGLYIWGAQLEAGAFATSYIPTAASQVTRTADVATIQGSNFYSWINQNAGSVYSQFVTPAIGNRNIVALDDNTANNNIRLRTEGTDPYLKQAWVGTEQVALDLGTVAANTEYKISAAYQINNYAGVIANGTVGTDTVANTPIIIMLRLGTDQAGAYLNGTIKSFTYYPTRLNNDTLKGLTA